MNALGQWKQLFAAYGIAVETIKSNPNAVTLTGLAGAPVFRGVESYQELNELHTKARAKSDEMGRLLIIGLPLNHPSSLATLPGEIKLPQARVYAGNAASTFSLSGHKVENSLLQELKKETADVMANGTKVKAPLLNWLVKLAGKSWPYGLPASLSQLDGLLGLVCRDTSLIGHVRARQLSFGRGSANALLLPVQSLVLKNNGLHQRVSTADYRFHDISHEVNCESSRYRVHAQYADQFLHVLNEVDPEYAAMIGGGAAIGSSVLGKVSTSDRKVIATVSPNNAMAGV